MYAQPDNWSIVISGAWNLAILTPDGISKRLFNLPDGTPIQIEIAIDSPGLLRVIHDDVIVAPSSGGVEVAVLRNDLASLIKASQIGQKALEVLSETPVAAAGINFRYALKTFPDELLDLLKSPIDDAYSDNNFNISSSLTRRSLEHPPGIINVEISQSVEGKGIILMNFHYSSNSPSDLSHWLSRTEEFGGIAQKLLETIKVPVQQEAQE